MSTEQRADSEKRFAIWAIGVLVLSLSFLGGTPLPEVDEVAAGGDGVTALDVFEPAATTDGVGFGPVATTTERSLIEGPECERPNSPSRPSWCPPTSVIRYAPKTSPPAAGRC